MIRVDFTSGTCVLHPSCRKTVVAVPGSRNLSWRSPFAGTALRWFAAYDYDLPELRCAGSRPTTMHPSPPPHVIRLREPWERRTTVAHPADCKMEPATVVGFVRRFGLPTGLQSVDHVDLVLEKEKENASAAGRVLLNGLPLGEINENQRQQRYPITNLLQNRNLLAIEFSSIDPAISISHLIAEVRLEIFERLEARGKLATDH